MIHLKPPNRKRIVTKITTRFSALSNVLKNHVRLNYTNTALVFPLETIFFKLPPFRRNFISDSYECLFYGSNFQEIVVLNKTSLQPNFCILLSGSVRSALQVMLAGLFIQSLFARRQFPSINPVLLFCLPRPFESFIHFTLGARNCLKEKSLNWSLKYLFYG